MITRRSARRLALHVFAVATLVYGVRAHASEVIGLEPETQPFYKWAAASGDQSYGLVQPSLATGAAVVPIPISLPRGAGGMQPDLTLTYNSRRRFGNAGKGWELALPKITRSTRYGVDRAQACSPSECLYEYDGEELVRGGPEPGQPPCRSATRYWRRIHRFEKILFCEYDDYWIVAHKDGTTETFGRHWARQSKLAAGQTTFEYYLDGVVDPHGLEWRAYYSALGDSNNDGQTDGNGASAPRLEALEYTFRNGVPVGELRRVDVQWMRRQDLLTDHVDWSYGLPVSHDQYVAAVEVHVGQQRASRVILNHSYRQREFPTLLSWIQVCGATNSACLPKMRFQYTAPASNFWAEPVHITPSPRFADAQEWHDDYQYTHGSGYARLTQQLVDMNGDGYLDYVAVDCRLGVSPCAPKWEVLFGYGDRGFASDFVVWPGAEHFIRDAVWDKEPLGDPQNVRAELLDMNADGLPDLFTTSHIYLNTGSRFVKHGWGWAGSVRPDWTREYADYPGGYQLARTLADMADGNGDGCPDRFEYDDFLGHWLFRRNRLCDPAPVRGFAPPQYWDVGVWPIPEYVGEQVMARTFAGGSWDAFTMAGLIDINSDGLVDFFHNGWFYMGDGQGFQVEVDSTFSADLQAIHVALGDQRGPSLARAGTSLPVDDLDIRFQVHGLVDLNGDGFRDFVRGSNSYLWTVWFNTGQGLNLYPRGWQTPNTGVFHPIQEGEVIAGERLYGSLRTLDIFPDSAPELVFVWNYNMRVHENDEIQGVKPSLLTSINNGLGATVEISYDPYVGGTLVEQGEPGGGTLHHPVHVLSFLRQTAGYGQTVWWRFRYYEPYFDRQRRQFVGFGRVTEGKGDDLHGTSLEATEYLFGNGNAAREIVDPYTLDRWPDSPYVTGRLFAIRTTTDTAAFFQREVWTPWTTLPSVGGGAPVKLLTREYDVHYTGTWKWREEGYEYDPFWGDLVAVHDHGEVRLLGGVEHDYAYGDDELTTWFGYARDESRWMSLPNETRLCTPDLGGACAGTFGCDEVFAPGAPTDCLSRELAYYDDLPHGQLATGDMSYRALPVIESGWITDVAQTSYSHDAYGNVVRETIRDGATTHFAYTPSATYVSRQWTCVWKGKAADPPQGPPPHCSADGEPSGGAVKLETAYGWDERFGVKVRLQDPNGREVLAYPDALGRFEEVTSNGRYTAGHHSMLRSFSYGLGENEGDSYVEKRSYFGTGTSDYLTTRTYLDGLARPIQEKSPGDYGLWTTAARRYNSFGRVGHETIPFSAATIGFSADAFGSDPAVDYCNAAPPRSLRCFEYDFAGRETGRWLQSDQGHSYYRQATTYRPWETETWFVDTEVERGQIHRYDAHGRLVKSIQIGSQGVAGAASYSYDRLGNLSYVEDGGGSVTLMTHDNRGLLTSVSDPNLSNCGIPTECPWRYGYDRAGRLVHRMDAAGQVVSYRLDELGRTYYRDYCPGMTSCPATDVRLDYDEGDFGLGHLTRHCEVGSIGTMYSAEYDLWGRPKFEHRTVANRRTTTSVGRDLLGRITSVGYFKTVDVPDTRPGSCVGSCGGWSLDGCACYSCQVRSCCSDWEHVCGPSLPEPEFQVGAKYAYGSNGLPDSVYLRWANDWYDPIVDNVDYDPFGRPTTIAWANGLQSTYQYVNSGSVGATHTPGWEKVKTVDISPHKAMEYTYYDDGNIKTIHNATRGWTVWHDYDDADRLLRALRTGGSDSYQWFSYAPNGNLMQTWDALDTSAYLTYGYGEAGPHAVHSILSVSGNGKDIYYDVNGAVERMFHESTGHTDHYEYNFDHRMRYALTSCHTEEPRHPWQDHEHGTLHTGFGYVGYVMGYNFVANQDLDLTELCGFFFGSTRVSVWKHGNADFDKPDASALVTSANDWVCAKLEAPYRLSAGGLYTVAAALGMGARTLYAYRGGWDAGFSSSFTTPDGSLTVNGTSWCSGVRCVPPSTTHDTTAMLGMVDVGTVPVVPTGRETFVYYDGGGHRALKHVPASCGNSTRMVYYFGPHLQVLRENAWTGADKSYLERYVMLGDKRIAVVSERYEGGLLFLHDDPLRTINLTTDAQGGLESFKEYEPFGRVAARFGDDRGLRYGFTGQEEDAREQLVHMGARQYSPSLARMMSPDPIIPDLMNPQSLNRYSYAYNNPIRYRDPSGYDPLPWYAPWTVPFWDAGDSLTDSQWQEYNNSVWGKVQLGLGFGGTALLAGAGSAWMATAIGLAAIEVKAIKTVEEMAEAADDSAEGPGTPDSEPGQGKKYHYTDAPEESFRQRGMFEDTSATDDPNLSAEEVVDTLGVTGRPNKVIPVRDRGHFKKNAPFKVQPHKRGQGGGKDFVTKRRVPPRDILPARPLPRPEPDDDEEDDDR